VANRQEDAACFALSLVGAPASAEGVHDGKSLRLLLAAIAFYVRDALECQNPNNLPQSCCIDGVHQEVGCGINADGSRRTENAGMGCCLAGAR
jgi:hypothetical protein